MLKCSIGAKQVMKQQRRKDPERERESKGEEVVGGVGAGEHHNEPTLASVVVGFHRCACRGTTAAPGPYDAFQLCRDSGMIPATGQTFRSSQFHK